MPVNVPLLRKTLEHIEAHPEEHDQKEWRCGSTMCFAGHAAVLNGAQFVGDSEVIEPGDDEPSDIERYATRVLGLTWVQAEDLFYEAESLEDIQRVVTRLIEDAG